MAGMRTEVQDYMQGVRRRAEHHAKNVHLIVPVLVGFALMRADEVDYHRINGKLTNVSWIKVQGRRYAFSYGHERQVIQLRRGSIRGPVLFEFDNGTPVEDVDVAFATL